MDIFISDIYLLDVCLFTRWKLNVARGIIIIDKASPGVRAHVCTVTDNVGGLLSYTKYI